MVIYRSILIACCALLVTACTTSQMSRQSTSMTATASSRTAPQPVPQPASEPAPGDSNKAAAGDVLKTSEPVVDPRDNPPMFLELMSRYYMLEAGRTYQAKVIRRGEDKNAYWDVANPPSLRHYAVGFEWLNLKDIKNLREGSWTFLVRSVDRWHSDVEWSSIGLYSASYKCELIRIEDADD